MGADLQGKEKKQLFLQVFSTGATLANYRGQGKVKAGGRVLFLFILPGKREDTLAAITWCLLPFISSCLSTSGSDQS